MDLVAALRRKIEVLDEGEAVPGLQAVLLHINTAIRHLSRGQQTDEEAAFTDAVYRTNQAFEGSVKEAYRILAGKDPAKERPYDIERYLEQNKIFRSRVLKQLNIYRTEWRNPSTHDYRLDFDESEAFLAIVSVSAFACVLLDQMAERLAYIRAQAESEAHKAVLEAKLDQTVSADLLARVTQLITQFCAIHLSSAASSGKATEPQVVGALNGFLSAAASDFTVQTEAGLDADRAFRADLLVSRGEEHVVVEIKRGLRAGSYTNALLQVEQFLHIGGIKNGVLLFMPDRPSEMERLDITVAGIDGRLVVLSPRGSNPSLARAANLS